MRRKLVTKRMDDKDYADLNTLCFLERLSEEVSQLKTEKLDTLLSKRTRYLCFITGLGVFRAYAKEMENGAFLTCNIDFADKSFYVILDKNSDEADDIVMKHFCVWLREVRNYIKITGVSEFYDAMISYIDTILSNEDKLIELEVKDANRVRASVC